MKRRTNKQDTTCGLQQRGDSLADSFMLALRGSGCGDGPPGGGNGYGDGPPGGADGFCRQLERLQPSQGTDPAAQQAKHIKKVDPVLCGVRCVVCVVCRVF